MIPGITINTTGGLMNSFKSLIKASTHWEYSNVVYLMGVRQQLASLGLRHASTNKKNKLAGAKGGQLVR